MCQKHLAIKQQKIRVGSSRWTLLKYLRFYFQKRYHIISLVLAPSKKEHETQMEFLTRRRWTSSSLPRATWAFGWFWDTQGFSTLLWRAVSSLKESTPPYPHPHPTPIHNEISVNSSWCHSTLPSETFLKRRGHCPSTRILITVDAGSPLTPSQALCSTSQGRSSGQPWLRMLNTWRLDSQRTLGPQPRGLWRGNSFFIKRERD